MCINHFNRAATAARGTARALAVVTGLLLSAPLMANDAMPAAGTLSPASPTLSFTAGPFALTNESYSLPTGGMCSPQPLFRCDDYALTIDLPADYLITHPTDFIRVTTSWPDKSEDFDITLLDDQGTDVSAGQSATGSDPEVAIIPAGGGTYVLTVQIVPYTAKGGTTTTTVELVTPVPTPPQAPPPAASGAPPRFYVYAAPAALGNAGEPSVGYNPKTKRAMYLATGGGTLLGGQALQVTFPENFVTPIPEACDANWIDVTPPELSVLDVDGILVTDPATGRTFASELLSVGPALAGVPGGLIGFNSIFAYTDDDGQNWTPGGLGPPQTTLPPGVIGTQVVDGLDHQTVGVGPYAAGTKPALSSYDNAVYYCSQGYIEAFCTRSDDGGLTFPSTGVVIYTSADDGCGGLHGHVRVAPDGTVYVPNKNCNGHAAVAVSEDSGMHWTVHEDPYSSKSGSDPQMALSSDGTGYLCYVGDDGHVRASVTHDKGKTWINDTDIGYYAGIKSAVFPQAIAGDPDRASCAFIGSTTEGNYQSMDFPGIWYPYVATTYDGGKSWHAVNVSPTDPVQREGGIWLQGGGATNRNLLDFNEITLDEKGRPLFMYADGCVGQCVQESPNSFSAHATLARMSGGRTLLSQFDPPAQAPALGACLAGTRDQSASHLSWRVPDNGGAAISSYKIYRGASPDAQALLTQTKDAKPVFDDVATDSSVSSYTYKITALNAAGEGLFSNLVTLPVTATPVVGTPCTLPGVAVVSDPSGDATGNVPGTDLQSISVAEPAQMDGKLVITLKVDSLTAQPAPATRWVAYLSTPTPPPNGDENYYLAMTTDSGTVAFEYGTSVAASPDPSGTAPALRTYHRIGDLDAASGYSTDGTIVLIVDKSALGTLNPGDQLTGITASTRASAPDAAGGQGLSLDTTDSAGYTLRAADACMDGGRGPLAMLVADVISGTAPLTVNFDGSGTTDPGGDTIASYTFNFGDGSPEVTQADPKIQHTYQQNGRYAATMTAKNSHGADSSNIARVVIQVGATATTTRHGRFGGALGLLLLLPLSVAALRRRRRG